MSPKSRNNLSNTSSSNINTIKSSHSQHPNQKERVKQHNGPSIKLKGKPINPKHRSLPSPVPQNKAKPNDNKVKQFNQEFKSRPRRNSLSHSSSTPQVKNNSARPRVKAQANKEKSKDSNNKAKAERRKTVPSSKPPALIPGSIQIQKRPTKESNNNILLDALLLGKPKDNATNKLELPVDPNMEYHSDTQTYSKTNNMNSVFVETSSTKEVSTFEQDLDMATHLLMSLLRPTPVISKAGKPKGIDNIPYAGPTFRRAPDPKALPLPLSVNRLTS